MRKIDPLRFGCAPHWSRYEGNPILGDDFGETYDISMVHLDNGKLRMYLSIRNIRAIGYTESDDGINWGEIVSILTPRPGVEWEDDVNRPMVLYHDGKFEMWYTALHYFNPEDRGFDVSGSIGYAVSDDGINWTRLDRPVLTADAGWENGRTQCPHVMYENGKYRLWYSGGGFWEPDRMGYAESDDGINWQKYADNPIFEPDPTHFWERQHTEACNVIHFGGYYYMFYIGMEDMYRSTINAARSRDGITGWERCPDNPLITEGLPGSWDVEAMYKPWIEKAEKGWRLYSNCRNYGVELIGLFLNDSDELFPEWK